MISSPSIVCQGVQLPSLILSFQVLNGFPNPWQIVLGINEDSRASGIGTSVAPRHDSGQEVTPRVRVDAHERTTAVTLWEGGVGVEGGGTARNSRHKEKGERLMAINVF